MGAYDEIERTGLELRLRTFLPRINIRHSEPTDFTFASGLLTHYYVLKEQDYQDLIK
jgi:hypothetical protein